MRAMEESEIAAAEEELYNHVSIFLENNANLLQAAAPDNNDSEDDGGEGAGGPDDSRIDQNYSN